MVRYCQRCVYPRIAVNLVLDDDNICSACRLWEEFEALTPEYWAERERLFREIVEKAKERNRGRWDCVVPVSGGKDSYYQVHVAKSYGLHPLLITYHGNNYLPEGQGNLDRMRDVLGVDHIVFGPSIETLKKLNRVCFRKMGDMNWHAHAGIFIYPMALAARLRIPLVLWGETFWDIAGMFSAHDYVKYNKRMVIEHAMRGFTWEDMVGEDGLTEADLCWLRFADDLEVKEVGLEGICIGNFFKWDPNEHAKLVMEKYRWEPARQPFERTYRTISNLDDMHENGLHDYLKFIKFGYGRASDHASKDVRSGYMTRAQAIEMVRRYDHVKPRRDLERWLQYVGMTEEEFDCTCDRFRDPRVWRIEKGHWVKDNVWGEPSSYGPVHDSSHFLAKAARE